MKAVRGFFAELHRRDPLLSTLGWILMALLVVAALVAPFDSRRVLGIGNWIKPAKFLISIAVFLWTIGWLLYPLSCYLWLKRIVRWGIGGSMVLEMVLILLQGARGVRSHFNFESPFDGSVFALMGILVGISTFLTAGLLIMYCTERHATNAPYRWSVRLGLTLFLAASIEGILMITRGAHAVGVADGGPGLPFVNWSTMGGDLRVAHFLGLHALQAIPLFAWGLRRLAPEMPTPRQTLAVFAFAAIYAGAVYALYAQAMAGRPLLGN